MTKAKFKWAKPHANIGATGHVDHGKTTLTAVISRVLHDEYPELNPFTPFDEIDRVPEECQHGTIINIVHVEYWTSKRRYAHIDVPGYADYVKNMVTGAAQMDGAVLVVAAADGPMAQTREHALPTRQVGAPALLVALNKSDMVDDEELPDLIETEVHGLLPPQDYDDDEAPVTHVSTLRALGGGAEWVGKVKELIGAVDGFIPVPERGMDKPFLMLIEDVFTIAGHDTTVTGRVEHGKLPINSEVEILGIREARKTTVTGIEMFHEQVDEAWTGENYGLLLRGTRRKDVKHGQVVCKPGPVTPHTESEGHIYILTKGEGGRHNLFYSNYRPQFCFHTTDAISVITLLEGTEMIMPGDTTKMTVQLAQPTAMGEDLGFAIHEDGRTVGSSRVAKVIK